VLKFPKEVLGMPKTLFFLDHDHAESGQEDGRSKSNTFEADFAIELATYILKQSAFDTSELSSLVVASTLAALGR